MLVSDGEPWRLTVASSSVGRFTGNSLVTRTFLRSCTRIAGLVADGDANGGTFSDEYECDSLLDLMLDLQTDPRPSLLGKVGVVSIDRVSHGTT